VNKQSQSKNRTDKRREDLTYGTMSKVAGLRRPDSGKEQQSHGKS
jgi:hypothetical protein